MELQPLERAKTYELVVRQIKNEIFAGRLKPGDRLPGERQLSELLNVSRPSVREAVRILQAMEIVRTQPGTGAGSGLVVSTHPSRALEDLLGLHVALSSYTVGDVMGARVALECQVVRSLAEGGVPTSEELEDILERMSDPELDRSTFHDLDADFHVALARGAGNTFLADLMNAIREAVRRPMDKAFAGDVDWENRQASLVDEHKEIFRAVTSGDADLAEGLMRRHIEGVYADLPDIDEPETSADS